MLKRLELFGFKTFADRTVLDFPGGITAVVGPNGSGKSNVADAILWALGESNVRHLRGERVQDVIFAGAGNRRSLGMAEVSLTFDNSSGRLPVDEPEVTVTRRLYRSGDAECFINRTPCRLKDIYTLFLDTGIGRDAYNMLSQSDIDAVLSARSEDRRLLFEEAAGIKKYRVRKNEAERRLESTRANLDRVNDILSDIEERIGPLERSAKSAIAFREMDKRRAELERLVLAFDVRRLEGELLELTNRMSVTREELAAAQANRSAAEARESAGRLRITEIERTWDSTRQKVDELAGQRARAQAERDLLIQRAHDSLRQLEEHQNQLTVLNQRLEDAGIREKTARKQVAELEAAMASLEKRLESARTAAGIERAAARELSSKLQGLQSEHSRLQTLAAARAGEERALQAEHKRIGPAIERALERRREAETRRSALDAEMAAADEQRVSLETDLERLTDEAAESSARRGALDTDISSLEEALSETGRRATSLAERRRVLVETVESHEGFHAGVRSTLEAVRAGRLSGSYHVVADVLKVPAELEIAVETALGGHLQDIICDTDHEAREAISLLKQDREGRATFLPLDLLDPPSRVPLSPDIRNRRGVLGWAADLVTIEDTFRPAVENLLGRALVVEDMETAVDIVRSQRLPIRIVTIEGELVTASGTISGGRGRGSDSRLLARRREIEEIGASLGEFEAKSEDLAQRISDLRTERTALDEDVKLAQTAANEARLALADLERRKRLAEQTHKQIDSEIAGAERESSVLQDRQTRLLEQAKTLSADAGDAVTRAETIAAEIAELRTALGERGERVEAERTALEVETAATRERLKAARTDVERALSSARQADEEALRRKTAIGACEQERKNHEARSGEVKMNIAELNAAMESAEAESARLRQDRDTLLTETSGERASAQEAEQKSAGLQDALRKAELRAAQLETERTMLIQRLDVILHGEAETIGEDEEEAQVVWDTESVDVLLAEVPIPGGFARHSAVVEWNRLKRDISALGAVNPNADAEFQELSERRTFLTGQREDLFAADAKLRSVIQDIDRSTRQTFIETFQQVEEQFKIMFERLFGGGMTRLVLTDPENVLDSGIEIIAQPPGKKLQNLTLLSGGERALTAAALMFAFLRVRPSPFCVLDELDAPLDEANVGRFAAILRDFTEHSSFVVVTHNRGTMEVADALYGISMQEPGVSTVVSLKMEAEEKPA